MHFIKVVSIVSVIICLGLLYNHFGSTKTGEDDEIGGQYSSTEWRGWYSDCISRCEDSQQPLLDCRSWSASAAPHCNIWFQGYFRNNGFNGWTNPCDQHTKCKDLEMGFHNALSLEEAAATSPPVPKPSSVPALSAKAITDCSDDSCLRILENKYTMQRLVETCINDHSPESQCLYDLFPLTKKFIGFTAENYYYRVLCLRPYVPGLEVRNYQFIIFRWGAECSTKWQCYPDYGAATVASHDLRIPCQYDSRKHFKAHDSRNYIKADTNQLSIE
eukprot:471787_1